jgi:hypothetical protein
MKKIIILLLIVLSGVEVYSQDSLKTSELKSKTKIFEAMVYRSSKQVIKGYLAQITDSSVVLSKPIAFQVANFTRDSLIQIGYSDIREVKIQRPNSISRGASTGFLIGAGIGIVAGLAMPAGNKGQMFYTPPVAMAAILGIITGLVGTLVGVIVGTVNFRTFQINGSKEKFHDMRKDMVKKVY